MTPAEYKQARATLSLTHEQMAAALGIGLRTTKGYEKGEAVIPVTVERLVSAYISGHPIPA